MNNLLGLCSSSPLYMNHLTMTLISVDHCRHNTCAFPSLTSMPSLSLREPRTKPRSLFSQTSSQRAGMVSHSQTLGPAKLLQSSEQVRLV